MIRTRLGDITKINDVDAIVNAANKTLLGGGGVDGAIHEAAGPELLKECRLLDGCKTGQAKLTRGYNLPCEYVIHTVGPIWHGGNNDEKALLFSCYYKSLELAAENQIRRIAFPSISTGIYHFPIHLAAEIAMKAVKTYMNDHPNDIQEIVFVLFDAHTKYVYDEALKASNNVTLDELKNKYADDDNTVNIDSEKGSTNFFDNSYKARFIIDGLEYNSVSEYLKAEKADTLYDSNEYDRILLKANFAKYSQNPALRGKLLATKDQVLVSGSDKDNALGRCLAEIRDRFRTEYIEPEVAKAVKEEKPEAEEVVEEKEPVRLMVKDSAMSQYTITQILEKTDYIYMDELEALDEEKKKELCEILGIDAFGELMGFIS